MSLRNLSNKVLREIGREFESNRRGWLGLFGLYYLVLVLANSLRPLWFDELITYNIVSLHGIGAMWKALAQGADLNPPFFFISTWAATLIFGLTEFGLRVPAILGFFLLCCSLYVFVARRAGPSYGFIAMLLPILTGAFRFASEARAYGLALGLCGLAVVSWQRSTEGGPRAIPLACMVAALSGALLTHCYAVLMLAPFGIAQIIQDGRQRRFDWRAWICLVTPLSACITYIPLLTTIRPYALNTPSFRPTWHSLIAFYDFLLTPALWPLFLGALIVAFGAARDRRNTAADTIVWKTEEIALATGFLLIPLLAVLLAKSVTRIFVARYGLAAVIGVAILFTQAAATLSGRSRRVGAALILLMLGWPAASMVERIALGSTVSPEHAALLDRRPDLPLVLSSGLLFYELNHYASPQLAARMWYLTDEQSALRITGTDVFDKGLPALDRLFPFRAKLEDYHVFVRAHQRFLVYGYAMYVNDWLISKLVDDGARLTFVGQRMEEFGLAVLYDVQISGVQ